MRLPNSIILMLSFVVLWTRVMRLIKARKRSLGQGNIFSSVCQEFCPRGALPQCMQGYHPPGPGTPQTRHPPRTRHLPPEQCMLGDTFNEWAVGILLECNLVLKCIESVKAPITGQENLHTSQPNSTPAGPRQITSKSRFRSTSQLILSRNSLFTLSDSA